MSFEFRGYVIFSRFAFKFQNFRISSRKSTYEVLIFSFEDTLNFWVNSFSAYSTSLKLIRSQHLIVKNAQFVARSITPEPELRWKSKKGSFLHFRPVQKTGRIKFLMISYPIIQTRQGQVIREVKTAARRKWREGGKVRKVVEINCVPEMSFAEELNWFTWKRSDAPWRRISSLIEPIKRLASDTVIIKCWNLDGAP